MKKMHYIFLFFLAISLTNCAALEEMSKLELIERCQPVNAYNRGLTDGLTPHQIPRYNYAYRCETNQGAINQEYLRGFTEGLRSRPQEVNINKNINTYADVNNRKRLHRY